VILILAANTSFNGFPMLAAIMARDGYLPHQFVHRGSRLAYSNGIVVIGVLALALIVLFDGSTHALIPLFAIGVFLCFTLSQAGMVRHWLTARGPRWRRLKLAINGLGAVTTAIVTAVVVIIKLPEGAWLVVVIVPVLIVLFTRVHTHYAQVARETPHPAGVAGYQAHGARAHRWLEPAGPADAGLRALDHHARHRHLHR